MITQKIVAIMRDTVAFALRRNINSDPTVHRTDESGDTAIICQSHSFLHITKRQGASAVAAAALSAAIQQQQAREAAAASSNKEN